MNRDWLNGFIWGACSMLLPALAIALWVAWVPFEIPTVPGWPDPMPQLVPPP